MPKLHFIFILGLQHNMYLYRDVYVLKYFIAMSHTIFYISHTYVIVFVIVCLYLNPIAIAHH